MFIFGLVFTIILAGLTSLISPILFWPAFIFYGIISFVVISFTSGDYHQAERDEANNFRHFQTMTELEKQTQGLTRIRRRSHHHSINIDARSVNYYVDGKKNDGIGKDPKKG